MDDVCSQQVLDEQVVMGIISIMLTLFKVINNCSSSPNGLYVSK